MYSVLLFPVLDLNAVFRWCLGINMLCFLWYCRNRVGKRCWAVQPFIEELLQSCLLQCTRQYQHNPWYKSLLKQTKHQRKMGILATIVLHAEVMYPKAKDTEWNSLWQNSSNLSKGSWYNWCWVSFPPYGCLIHSWQKEGEKRLSFKKSRKCFTRQECCDIKTKQDGWKMKPD